MEGWREVGRRLTLRFAVLTTLGCMFWSESEVSWPWLVPSRRPLRALSVAMSEFEYTARVCVVLGGKRGGGRGEIRTAANDEKEGDVNERVRQGEDRNEGHARVDTGDRVSLDERKQREK